jgi:hypothetical protein
MATARIAPFVATILTDFVDVPFVGKTIDPPKKAATIREINQRLSLAADCCPLCNGWRRRYRFKPCRNSRFRRHFLSGGFQIAVRNRSFKTAGGRLGFESAGRHSPSVALMR